LDSSSSKREPGETTAEILCKILKVVRLHLEMKTIFANTGGMDPDTTPELPNDLVWAADGTAVSPNSQEMGVETELLTRAQTGGGDGIEIESSDAGSVTQRGVPIELREGDVIYAENEKLDDTFCVLLSGRLVVEREGSIIGQLTKGEVFGEMAYFNPMKIRTATVRVASPKATVLRIHLSVDALSVESLSALRQFLSRQAWDRFVNGSQGDLMPPAKGLDPVLLGVEV
jgi:hypothetical protein